MKRFASCLLALVLLQGSLVLLLAQSRPATIKIDTNRVIGEVIERLAAWEEAAGGKA